MANAWIVFQKMLVLFAMMLVGYFSYKKGILEKNSYDRLSRLVVTVMNPLLIIDGVLGKEAVSGKALGQNIFLMILYFVILILLSFPVTSLLRISGRQRSLYKLMLIFSNVGFMGIPVITSLYGEGCVLYIAFYILGYNLLLYTYGLFLVDQSAESDKTKEAGADKSFTKRLSSIFNSGVLACLAAILIFALQLKVPQPAAQFVSSLGGCAVPLSMILIGASMAQQDFRSLFGDSRVYLFLVLRMLVIPLAGAFLLKMFDLDRQAAGVFGLMLAMPVGSIVVLLAANRGADETVCTRGSVISTLASVLTIPFIAVFLP